MDVLYYTKYEFSEIGKIIRSQLILDNGFCLSDNGKILKKTYGKNTKRYSQNSKKDI